MSAIRMCELFKSDHHGKPVCPRHFAISCLQLQAEVGAYIKTLQVCVHGSIHHVQSPEQQEHEHGIIDVTAELVAVVLQCAEVVPVNKKFQVGMHVVKIAGVFCRQHAVGITKPLVIIQVVYKNA